jgi:hypothetical protein
VTLTGTASASVFSLIENLGSYRHLRPISSSTIDAIRGHADMTAMFRVLPASDLTTAELLSHHADGAIFRPVFAVPMLALNGIFTACPGDHFVA